MNRKDQQNKLLNNKRRADNDLERPRENNNFHKSYDYRGQNNNEVPIHKVELPINKHKNEILRSINENQVIIIAGETGCGKTTQVPQYIYQELKSKGEKVNILITQPRRIAAYSIAKRLSHEMKKPLGEEVGYHYGMTPVFIQGKTEILIMTTGIFLQRIVHEKKLDDFTHIILDEVHERDIDIDFVLVLVKFLLENNSKTKLILMSATIATTLFANYFSVSSIKNILNNVYDEERKRNKELEDLSKNDNSSQNEKKTEDNTWVWGENQDYTKNNNDQIGVHGIFTVTEINKDEKKNFSNSELLADSAPIVRIDQRIYNVNIFYLDTFIERLGQDLRKSYNAYNTNFDKKNPKIDQNLYDIALDLIINIHRRNIYKKEPQGRCYHVLVFLPGFAEIETMYQILYSKLSPDEKYGMEILKLHSNLQDEDQQRVFLETDKRKVILSTNIAESSITINDIYYVIDFCLVKELKFNLKTNHQSLDLNWASKASCNQRSGRAGRVGEGFVFRLVPSKFFEHIQEAFSSPEILRVPLEKLILKVKVLDQGEPDLILGQALEPPNLKHIESAIQNLQNMGALTLPTEKSATGELTELGIVYSEMPIDIKYSRLIMLGYAFGMLDPAIVTACVLTHEKNIFRKPNADNYRVAFGQKYLFSDNTDSDMVKYYNAFKEWELNFGHSLHKDQYSRKISGRDYQDERNFCAGRMLDSKVLRDVLALVADVKLRLRKLNLINEELTKQVDFKVEDNQIIFKLILGGAFYGNYAKCQYMDIEKLRKVKNSKVGHDHSQAVTIKSVPMEVEDKELLKFCHSMVKENPNDIKDEKSYVPVDQENKFILKRCGDDVVLVFDKEICKESIKKIMNLGSTYRPRESRFGLPIYLNKHTNEVRFHQFKRPEYIYELKSTDLFTSIQVDMEYNSINHIMAQDDEKKVSNMFLVYEDHHMKNGKYTAKHSTMMPSYPMLDLILMLIFTPKAVFYPNETKDRYGTFRLIGTDLEFRFNYHFATCDVTHINNIRQLLNEIIASKSEDEQKICELRKLLIEYIFSLIKKSRILIISNEEWWKLFYKIYPEKKILKENNLKPTNEILQNEQFLFLGMGNKRNKSNQNPNSNNQVRSDVQTNNINHNNISSNGFTQISGKNNKKIKKTNDFLPPLDFISIREDFRLFTETGIQELKEENKCFEDMRDYIIKKISELKKLINNDKTSIVCALCNSYLCSVRNLKHKSQGVYQVSGWVSGFVNLLKSNSQDFPHHDPFFKFFNLDSSKIDEWIACKANNHILGFKIDHDYYITEMSNLRIIYPTDISIRLDAESRKDNFAKVFEEERKYLTNRQNKINQGLECKLCDFKTTVTETYLDHVEKDIAHKRRMTELLEENFDQ